MGKFRPIKGDISSSYQGNTSNIASLYQLYVRGLNIRTLHLLEYFHKLPLLSFHFSKVSFSTCQKKKTLKIDLRP